MTLGELRTATKDIPDDYEVQVYIPYEAVTKESGKGKPEKGSIVKDVSHIATRLVSDTVVITTDVTTWRPLVMAAINKEETK